MLSSRFLFAPERLSSARAHVCICRRRSFTILIIKKYAGIILIDRKIILIKPAIFHISCVTIEIRYRRGNLSVWRCIMRTRKQVVLLILGIFIFNLFMTVRIQASPLAAVDEIIENKSYLIYSGDFTRTVFDDGGAEKVG